MCARNERGISRPSAIGGFQISDQCEFRGRLLRQGGMLFTLEDPELRNYGERSSFLNANYSLHRQCNLARAIISGAAQDTASVAHVAPTTIMFVPCLGGISHNEAESTNLEECAAGAQVLLNAVLEFDRRLG